MKRKIWCLTIAALLCLSLCGCGQSGFRKGGGEVTGTVRNIDLEWNVGSVTIKYHPESTVLLEESSIESIPASQRMRWTLAGDTLRVYSAKPGKTPMVQKKKNLTLTLPEGFQGGELEFSLDAADLRADILRAEELEVETSTGTVTLTVEDARDVSLCTGAGKISLTQLGSLDSLELSAATADMDVTLENVNRLEAESASGAIRVTAQWLGAAEIGTDVGDVNLYLPASTDFTADVRTGVGSFDSGFELTREGDRYVAGFGRSYIEIETAAGSLRIDPIA